MTTLDLSSNRLKIVPESIGNLPNLTTLNLTGNPIEEPPLEIVKKGIEAIRDYYRQVREEGLDYIYEAKLLIVGEGGSGKTTLARKIENPNYQLQEEESTKGIDVIQWKFPMDNSKDFRVNIWDFGGQEIYHATHQFFLTKRSLYTLVADTRKEDTDFYYWLNVVELLSENSPLLIIKNEKQNRKREINDRALRGEFTNLKEILATNLATNRGLDDILTQVKHYISNLDHIGTALPKTWKQVREALEQDRRNYISLDEYLTICAENGFTLRKDKLQLSEYLHDLGVCLHFQDEEDSLLYKTVILKPEWGTDAVYKVLDNPQVIDNQGRFSRDDLKNIWQEENYAAMRGELLELMKKFQLCYEIPERKNTFITPQLLTENQPEYIWDPSNNLILRYAYPAFMPKGIVTRFIIAMHEYIDQQKYVWRSGVILNKDNTKAEIIEKYSLREIRIRVVGANKRDFMTIIAHEIEKINNSYKRLKYQKLIPCNCTRCKNLCFTHKSLKKDGKKDVAVSK
ncbi:MAG: COR domain-containing protein [Cyanobacteria bacterium P01_F01_bin.143]